MLFFIEHFQQNFDISTFFFLLFFNLFFTNCMLSEIQTFLTWIFSLIREGEKNQYHIEEKIFQRGCYLYPKFYHQNELKHLFPEFKQLFSFSLNSQVNVVSTREKSLNFFFFLKQCLLRVLNPFFPLYVYPGLLRWKIKMNEHYVSAILYS